MKLNNKSDASKVTAGSIHFKNQAVKLMLDFYVADNIVSLMMMMDECCVGCCFNGSCDCCDCYCDCCCGGYHAHTHIHTYTSSQHSKLANRSRHVEQRMWLAVKPAAQTDGVTFTITGVSNTM